LLKDQIFRSYFSTKNLLNILACLKLHYLTDIALISISHGSAIASNRSSINIVLKH